MTLEEREILQDFLHGDAYKILTIELLNFAKSLESEVTNYNLATGDATQLAYAKCRAEGAMKLFKIFSSHLESFRIKSLNADGDVNSRNGQKRIQIQRQHRVAT